MEKAVKLMAEKSLKFDEHVKAHTMAEIDTKAEKKKKSYAKKEALCTEKSTKAKEACIKNEKMEKELAAKEQP